MEPNPPGRRGDPGDSDPVRGLEHLAMVSTELNARVAPEEVTTAAVDLALGLNGSTVASVVMLTGGGSVMAHVGSLVPPSTDTGAGSGRDTGTSPVDWREFPSIAEMPRGVIRDCMRSGERLWRGEDAPSSDADAPHATRHLSTLMDGVEMTVAHPVHDAAGELLGAFALGWHDWTPPSAEVRATCELFCELVASSLTRSMRVAELSDLAAQLRTALLPTYSSHRELDVAFDYVPASHALGFGGDWFDLVDRSEDDVVLVVGDVTGHGVMAAARMALAQGAVRALAAGAPLNDIPLLASAVLTGAEPEMYATLGLIEIDLSDMAISCVLAGHPPPMVRSTGGGVQRLGGDPAPPIGLVSSPMEPTDGADLFPGCLIVLYSDGLIERREEAVDDRLDQLESVVAGLRDHQDAASALSEICEAMLTDEAEDDVAILVVRVNDVAA